MTDDDIREIADSLDTEDDGAIDDAAVESDAVADDVPADVDAVADDTADADAAAGDVPADVDAAADDTVDAETPSAEPVDEAEEPVDAVAVDGDDTEEPLDALAAEEAADHESMQETTLLPAVDGPWAAEDTAETPFADEPLPGESELVPLDPVAAAEADAAANAATAEGELATAATGEGDAATAATTEGEAAPAEAPLMDFGPERRSGAWIWWTLTALAIAATIGVGLWWYTSLRTVAVPNLVGQKTADAVFAIADLDLILGDAAEVSTDTVPPGQVVGQRPDAGTELHPGDSVSLLISKAPETSKVPEVKQKLREDAEETLAKASLRPYVVQSYSPTTAADYVIAQLPANGTELAPGSTVVLAVSKGPAPASVRIPNLSGMSSVDAMQLLDSLDLIGKEYRSVDPSKTAGVIGTQIPAAGSSAKMYERVFFSVIENSTAAPVIVPNTLGAKRKAAEKLCTDKGLKTQLTYVSDPRVPKDQVIRQMPLSGERIARGGTVGLLISTGTTETLSVPNLTGKNSADAEAAVTKAGFAPVVVPVRLPGASAGMTIAQFPAAGEAWYYRFPVIVLVGKL